MEDVTLAHAKEHLEDLIARAARGEEVCIATDAFGTVKLQPISASASPPQYPKRIIGLRRDIPEIPDERLFAPLTEEEPAWLSGEQSKVE